jgi:hypothetical protein
MKQGIKKQQALVTRVQNNKLAKKAQTERTAEPPSTFLEDAAKIVVLNLHTVIYNCRSIIEGDLGLILILETGELITSEKLNRRVN